MKKTIFALVAASLLVVPHLCLADEKADAEAAITEAENAIASMNSVGSWFGPALFLKTKAEDYLKMAKDAFDAGNCADAKKYADMALDYGNRALGMRAWLLLTRRGASGSRGSVLD